MGLKWNKMRLFSIFIVKFNFFRLFDNSKLDVIIQFGKKPAKNPCEKILHSKFLNQKKFFPIFPAKKVVLFNLLDSGRTQNRCAILSNHTFSIVYAFSFYDDLPGEKCRNFPGQQVRISSQMSKNFQLYKARIFKIQRVRILFGL